MFNWFAKIDAYVDKDKETTSQDFASSYDFCIVFPTENGTYTQRGMGYLRALKQLGFETFAYSEDSKIFLLLRISIDKLREYAHNVGFRMLLNDAEIEKLLGAGDTEYGIKPSKITHMPEITHYTPYKYIYGKFRTDRPESLYWRKNDGPHPFRDSIKLKICAMILEHRLHGKENLKIRRYLNNGWLLGCFALHNEQQVNQLEKHWGLFPLRPLPLNEFKEYFGEKLGLFYAFLQFYTACLLIPGIISIPLQVIVFITNDFSSDFLPIYSMFVTLWAVTMLEFWKRREKVIAMEWGMIGYEEAEVDRPDFKGVLIDSFIDGSKLNYFSHKKRRLWEQVSFLAISALILLVLGIVAAIYILRFTIRHDLGKVNAQIIVSIINAVQIQVLNFIYPVIAKALVEFENHRTSTGYEDSLIVKLFVFQFINSYASFFYLAFIAESFGECPNEGCMTSLAVNVAVIFGSRLATSILSIVIFPYCTYLYRLWTSIRKKKIDHDDSFHSRSEQEFLLDPYDSSIAILYCYAEVAIDFGYTAMFITALPIGTIGAIISSIFLIRSNGWRLIRLHQRPFPIGCEDIGTWQTIFYVIGLAAVITNAGITVFTMSTLDHYSTTARFTIFVGFQWICFGAQLAAVNLIPDVPEEVNIQLKRKDFIVRKLIYKVPDEDSDNEDVASEKLDALSEIDKLEKYPR